MLCNFLDSSLLKTQPALQHQDGVENRRFSMPSCLIQQRLWERESGRANGHLSRKPRLSIEKVSPEHRMTDRSTMF